MASMGKTLVEGVGFIRMKIQPLKHIASPCKIDAMSAFEGWLFVDFRRSPTHLYFSQAYSARHV